jgi:hypothetical protein
MPVPQHLVSIEQWTHAQHALAIKTFYKATIGFQQYVKISNNNPVPSVQDIKTWFQNVSETGMTLKIAPKIE